MSSLLTKERRMTRAVNVLALVKDDDRYVFLFDEDSYEELLRQLGEFASDPELSFSWYDAAVLSQRVRALQEQADLEAADEFDRLSGLSS